MGAMLTKHRTVMKYQSRYVSGNQAVTYASIDDDTNQPRELFTMAFDLWEEMDRPPEITVTVEPGDKLNESLLPHDYEGDGVVCRDCGLTPNSYLHPGYDPDYARRQA